MIAENAELCSACVACWSLDASQISSYLLGLLGHRVRAAHFSSSASGTTFLAASALTLKLA